MTHTPLTAEQAYQAGRDDFTHALACVLPLFGKGTKQEYVDAFVDALTSFWKVRIEIGQLPPVEDAAVIPQPGAPA